MSGDGIPVLRTAGFRQRTVGLSLILRRGQAMVKGWGERHVPGRWEPEPASIVQRCPILRFCVSRLAVVGTGT
jgi:hypothetical protein